MPLIEKRYSEALISLSAQKNEIDIYQQELQMIVELFKGQQEFRLFLLNPEIKTEVKKKVIDNAFSTSVKKELVDFLYLLLDKGRIRHLSGISDEYTKAADKIRNTLNITIISAIQLEDKQINDIVEKYKRLYHSTSAKLYQVIDKSLIGGVKVKIGDKVVDGSITGRLEALRQLIIDD